MSNAPEEFEQLRKLLKLKRYEQPSARFFNEFSGNVIAGVRVAKTATLAERLWDEAPWLARFFRLLETNALVAGGFASAICGVLLGGIAYSEYMDQVPMVAATGSEGALKLVSYVAPM